MSLWRKAAKVQVRSDAHTVDARKNGGLPTLTVRVVVDEATVDLIKASRGPGGPEVRIVVAVQERIA